MKKEKGITLIALIITIIVLLILAGITIASVLGDNGILGKANTAKINTEEATILEELRLKASSNVLEDVESNEIIHIDYFKSDNYVKEEFEEDGKICYVINPDRLNPIPSRGKGDSNRGDIYYLKDGVLYYKERDNGKLIGNVFKDINGEDIWIYEEDGDKYRIVGIKIKEFRQGSETRNAIVGESILIVPNTHNGKPVEEVSLDYLLYGETTMNDVSITDVKSLIVSNGIKTLNFRSNDIRFENGNFSLALSNTVENLYIDVYSWDLSKIILQFPNGINSNIIKSDIANGVYRILS